MESLRGGRGMEAGVGAMGKWKALTPAFLKLKQKTSE